MFVKGFGSLRVTMQVLVLENVIRFRLSQNSVINNFQYALSVCSVYYDIIYSYFEVCLMKFKVLFMPILMLGVWTRVGEFPGVFVACSKL